MWIMNPIYINFYLKCYKYDVHFHDLRRTAATWQHRAGSPVTDIQKLLGHSSIRMTEEYIHVHDGVVNEMAARMADKIIGKGIVEL